MRARDRLQSLTVADVMTHRVVPIVADTPLEKIVEVFTANGISSAPVVDAMGRCVGVVSAVDLVARGAGSGRELTQDVMSRAVKSVGGSESLLKAAQLMCANHIHRLPVTDQGHRVVGVISTMDIVAAVLNAIDEADASAFPGSRSEPG